MSESMQGKMFLNLILSYLILCLAAKHSHVCLSSNITFLKNRVLIAEWKDN